MRAFGVGAGKTFRLRGRGSRVGAARAFGVGAGKTFRLRGRGSRLGEARALGWSLPAG